MHITDIKRFIKCPKLYSYYNIMAPSSQERISFYNLKENITESVANKLDLNDYVEGQVGQSSEKTIELSKEHNWIFKARFEFNDLRVRIPLIYIDDNHCTIYSTLLTTSISSEEYKTLKYYTYVLTNSGLTVDEIFIIHLNKDYVRENKLDYKKLWVVSNKYDNQSTIIEYVNSLEIDVEAIMEDMKNNDDTIPPVRTGKCSGRNRCEYFETCFPDQVDYEDNSILTLVSSQYKYDMFTQGRRYLKDVDINKLEGNKVQYAQIKADKNGGLFVDKCLLKKWLTNIEYPISFIDFEWDLYPIPPYKGLKPLDVLPFQYSLHVFDGTELKHYQYIGEGDCRKEMIKSLVQQMPSTGSVYAYNAKGAEKVRINEFVNYAPEYKEQLESINQRMYDLADPIINGMVYDTRLKGNLTLKAIEEIVDDDHSYHDLDCSNGMQAVVIHRNLEKCDDEDLKENYYQQLYKYCGLDTYSLYMLITWLQKISL